MYLLFLFSGRVHLTLGLFLKCLIELIGDAIWTWFLGKFEINDLIFSILWLVWLLFLQGFVRVVQIFITEFSIISSHYFLNVYRICSDTAILILSTDNLCLLNCVLNQSHHRLTSITRFFKISHPLAVLILFYFCSLFY